MRAWSIRDAEVDGVRVDVAMDGERITAVVPAGTARSEHTVDAGGGALIPGLHDHHLHLLALAAAATSVVCGPPAVTGYRALADELAAADRTLASSAWLRGVGYHESVAGDLDRHTLDALVPTRPCRVQHRSGHGWILNTAALAAIGIAGGGELPEGVEIDAAGAPTGRIYGLDGWLGDRVPRSVPDLAAVGRRLGAFGVTAVTDATPVTDPAALQPIVDAVRSGALPQHVAVTGGATLSTDALDLVDGITVGPAKVVLADHQLPPLDDVVGAMRTAHDRGRSVAVHCVTRAALALALAAWDDAGVRPGDRIEHGAVVPDEMAAHVAALGLTVVTQPGFVAERGDDYLADVDEDDRPYLWPCASLIAAGIPVGFGTDAPFGDADPWRAMAAAVERRTPTGAILGAAERLPARAALERFLAPLDDPGGAARRVAAGAPADLCLLDAPLAEALAEPSCEHVRWVLRRGTVLSR